MRSTLRSSSAVACDHARRCVFRSGLLAEAQAYAAERYAGRPMGTQIKRGGPFYTAEEHHQNYYAKHPGRFGG